MAGLENIGVSLCPGGHGNFTSDHGQPQVMDGFNYTLVLVLESRKLPYSPTSHVVLEYISD